MTAAAQGIEHGTRIGTVLTLAAYGDASAQEPPGHALAQMLTLAAHLARRSGDLDEDDLATDLAAAGWSQHDDIPISGTQQVLQLIGSGVAWWRAAPAHRKGQGSYGSDAAVRATAVGLLPGIPISEAAQLGRRTSMITHSHPDARDAAAVQACAMALACTEPGTEYIDIEKYVYVLSAQCRGKVMTRQLTVAGRLLHDEVTPARVAAALGSPSTAPAAAAAALIGFLRHPGQPLAALAWTRAMGTPWHASTVMAAALAGAACPQARPPVTWRAAAPLQKQIAAIAAALAAVSAPPGRRRLAHSPCGENRPVRPHSDGLSYNCHRSG